MAKIKTRFNTSILLFWRRLLLIYEAILTVPLRDRAEQEATTTDNATFRYCLDAIRTEHATKAAAAIAKCAPIKERLQDFTAEHKRIERATETLSQEMQKELGRERGRGHGISR
jgi:hypothetical protein